MKFALAFALALTLTGPAFATDLNAPLAPKPPSLGSEIKRGVDAARACQARNRSPADGADFSQCIDDAQAANRQAMGRGFEAFDVGLYYSARETETIYVKVMSDRPGFDPSVLKANLGVHSLAYEQDRDGLGLTDADVMKASVLG